MQFLLFEELLRTIILQYKTDLESFIKLFDYSEYLIGFKFHCLDQKFTHLSDSFRNILGYDQNRIIMTNNYSFDFVHPQDKTELREYFNPASDQYRSDLNQNSTCTVRKLKFRAKHIKGYWKYLIIFSSDLNSENDRSVEKIGVIANERFLGKMQIGNNKISNDTKGKFDPGFNSDNTKNLNSMVSPREYEILDYISKGLIAKEIANILNISSNTVITHRKNLISKFNVNNTAELIRVTSRLMII